MIFNSLKQKILRKKRNISNLEELKNYLHKYIISEKNAEKTSDYLFNREILLDILDNIQEGVEIVDSRGIVKYVNPAFLEITGLKKEDRIDKSVYNVSPDGGLVKVLENKKPVRNLQNFPKGTSAKLVSNASPIIICGQMIGAITTLRNQKDIFTLTEKLKKSEKELKNLTEKITNLSSSEYTFNDFIGSCPATKQVMRMAQKATTNNSVVLLQGETGTGKEIIANAIHNGSYRSENPFVCVNCSAIPENLLESEFFGHEKGAFTGAQKRKLGKFELANKGTIFLDEIGEMPLSLQVKILRVIQEKKIQRLGGEKVIPVDVRIIAATNRNLEKMIKDGNFREDLYYRLNVWNIQIPPLRERKEDLHELVTHILEKKFKKIGRNFVPLAKETFDLIYNYDWPGNVRELENVLERAVINCSGKAQIEPEDLKLSLAKDMDESKLKGIMPLHKAEKIIIKNALERFGYSYEAKKRIADEIGVSLATLYNKIKKYNLG